MVETIDGHALRRELQKDQYASEDSSPGALSHPVPYDVAPRVLAIFSVVTFCLMLLFNRTPIVQFFPERDLFFSRYDGALAVPLRLFIIGFVVAFSSAIDAGWRVRIRFGGRLLLFFLAFCLIFDMANLAAFALSGVRLTLTTAELVSALMGFLIFSLHLIRTADMPARSDAPLGRRLRLQSFLTAMAILAISAAVSIRVAGYELDFIQNLRDVALMGGVSVGIFLFVPLVYFLLNVLASLQSIFRRHRTYQPPITLIIPAHNESHVIGACIAAADAAAGRYGGPVTLFVIDNASIDDTSEQVRAALADARHLEGELLHEPRRGKSFALNRGLDAVETGYFARVDADTLLSQDALMRAFNHFGDTKVGVVGGLALPPGNGPFDGPRYIEVLLKMGYDQVGLGAADCIVGIAGMFACYDTRAARLVGGFAVGMNGEDTDIAFRIGEAGYRLLVDPAVTFISEVPRTFSHLREQRTRWFRSIFHVTARNIQDFLPPRISTRGWLVLPYMLTNTARRAMALPLVIFCVNFLILDADPYATLRAISILALFIGTPMVNAILAIVVNLRLAALISIPSYIVFRMLRSYLTLEALLSMNFNNYSSRGVSGSVRVAPGG